MATYYLGLKYGNDANVENVLAGTVSVGATADVEVRWQDTNGLTRKGLNEALQVILAFINGGGSGPGAGANLPAL